MVDSPESPTRYAGPILRIDEQLLAAAIWEVSLAYRPGGELNEVGTFVARGGRKFFLLILLELMLPEFRSDQVQHLVWRLAIAAPLAPLPETLSFETQALFKQ